MAARGARATRSAPTPPSPPAPSLPRPAARGHTYWRRYRRWTPVPSLPSARPSGTDPAAGQSRCDALFARQKATLPFFSEKAFSQWNQWRNSRKHVSYCFFYAFLHYFPRCQIFKNLISPWFLQCFWIFNFSKMRNMLSLRGGFDRFFKISTVASFIPASVCSI